MLVEPTIMSNNRKRLDGMVGSGRSYSVSIIKKFDLNQHFLFLIAAYVVLLGMVAISGSGLLKAISYVMPFVVFVAIAWQSAYVKRNKDISLGFWAPLVLYYYGMFGSVLFNLDNGLVDWPLVIKLLMGPLFVVFGVSFESQRTYASWELSNVRKLFYVLLIFPIVVWLFQIFSGSITFKTNGAVSIFANRNNAALYVVALIGLLNVLRDKPVKNAVVFAGVGIGFATNGVFLATLVAIALSVGKLKIIFFYFIFGALLVAGLYYFPIDVGVFSRIQPIIDSVLIIFDGRVDVRTVTYGELVQRLNTTDLSLFFRLKHWLNLFSLYSGGDFSAWIFGFGIGAFVKLSDAGLVPHNDYLRYLFECGAVAFSGFVFLVIKIVRNCGRRWELVPILTIVLYFFSENLVDNFVAMAVFYFVSGSIAFRVKSPQVSSS